MSVIYRHSIIYRTITGIWGMYIKWIWPPTPKKGSIGVNSRTHSPDKSFMFLRRRRAVHMQMLRKIP